jgi:hypothetical protein
MMYGVTVRDFARRTRKNLKTIEELSSKEPNRYFEITQLVNSAVGLLMFPQQEFFDQLPETSLDQLQKDGWPIPTFEYGGERTGDLRSLARHIRNSLAHFNIDFKPEGGRIEGLYLWNRVRESEPPNWLCYISVKDLRVLFDRFAKIAENESFGSAYSEVRVEDVRKEIEALRG